MQTGVVLHLPVVRNREMLGRKRTQKPTPKQGVNVLLIISDSKSVFRYKHRVSVPKQRINGGLNSVSLRSKGQSAAAPASHSLLLNVYRSPFGRRIQPSRTDYPCDSSTGLYPCGRQSSGQDSGCRARKPEPPVCAVS